MKKQNQFKHSAGLQKVVLVIHWKNKEPMKAWEIKECLKNSISILFSVND